MKNKISWTPLNNSEGIPDEMLLTTPLGIFKANDHSSPFHQFHFEIMNTNFRIMRSMIPLLNGCDGIESVTLLSGYRAAISFGKLFDCDKIKQMVELRLVGRILNTEVSVDVLPNSLKSKIRDSGTLVFPNGHIEYLGKEDEEQDREVMKKCAELVGGIYYENV